MPELSDRDKLRNTICAACNELPQCVKFGNVCFEVACINNAPTIEAEPVKHGRWIMLEPYGTHHAHRRKCSECGEIKAQELTNFCQNCGTNGRRC